MPHRHPEARIYTVISGVFYIGLGPKLTEERLVAFPFGSLVVLPGREPHFHFAKSGKYVTQVTAIGPLGLEYVDPSDDPRNMGSTSAAQGGGLWPLFHCPLGSFRRARYESPMVSAISLL